MRTANMKQMVDLGKLRTGPWATIMDDAKGDPVKMLAAIKEKGWEIHEQPTPGGRGIIVEIRECKVIPEAEREPYGNGPEWDGHVHRVLASGTHGAGDKKDAFLHAVLGAIREEWSAKVVSDALKARGYEVDPRSRQLMESELICNGQKRLDSILADMDRAYEAKKAEKPQG